MVSLSLSKKLCSSLKFSVFDIRQTGGCKVTNSFNNLGNGTQNFANAKIMLTGGCCCCCTSFDLHGTVSPNRTSTKSKSPPLLNHHSPTTFLDSP